MERLIPKSWLPVCSMKRIILHWTAGGYEATELDKEHYHILIEGDGKLIRGNYSIADNANTADGRYAAHTRNCNTGSIGVAMCCMAGARRSPFDAGQFPVREIQFAILIRCAAELSLAYDIRVTPQTVLGHGEVERELGIPQAGKWDPMRLPFQPELYAHEVGSLLRESIIEQKARIQSWVRKLPETPVACAVEILLADGREIEASGIVANGTTYVKIYDIQSRICVRKLPLIVFGADIYVSCRRLAEKYAMNIGWDSGNRTVRIVAKER